MTTHTTSDTTFYTAPDHGNTFAVPQRLYPAATIHGDDYPETIATDHSDPNVAAECYRLRNRQGDQRMTHEEIAEHLALRCWRDSYNATRNYGRRRDGENGRNTNGDLTWRAWNQPRNMRNNPAAPARPGSRTNQATVTGRFGIEIEFNSTSGYTTRSDATHALTAQGVRIVEESYNHTVRDHWKMTTDATVTGGECVSPIMAGDTASLDEVRDVLRAIKDAGGTTGRNVGMHVHHDCTDFTTSEAREHLVDVLRATEAAMGAYVMQARVSPGLSCGAAFMNDREWDIVRSDVQNITPGANPRSWQEYGNVSRYRFFNIVGPLNKYGTVEMRGLGATLHAGKVRVWVRMGQALIEYARRGLTFDHNPTPEELVDTLRGHNLIGQRTGTKFLSEVARRRNT